MHTYVLGLQEIHRSQVALVGGKGANLGDLSRLDGIRVPGGFCVTTAAYQRVIAAIPRMDERLDRLMRLVSEDHEAIRSLSDGIRRSIEAVAHLRRDLNGRMNMQRAKGEPCPTFPRKEMREWRDKVLSDGRFLPS